ncbi:MAG: hypothetical protein K5654_05255 [Lachnospiraceae bacterium]|nr:hypothetical protein [Lachnospiraceae bacterium]
MGFYIGNSIEDINEQDNNKEFGYELIDFIYKNNHLVSFNMRNLYQINPYSDIALPGRELSQISEIYIDLLNRDLLMNYDEPDEGK